jgi:hypothetical protein
MSRHLCRDNRTAREWRATPEIALEEDPRMNPHTPACPPDELCARLHQLKNAAKTDPFDVLIERTAIARNPNLDEKGLLLAFECAPWSAFHNAAFLVHALKDPQFLQHETVEKARVSLRHRGTVKGELLSTDETDDRFALLALLGLDCPHPWQGLRRLFDEGLGTVAWLSTMDLEKAAGRLRFWRAAVSAPPGACDMEALREEWPDVLRLELASSNTVDRGDARGRMNHLMQRLALLSSEKQLFINDARRKLLRAALEMFGDYHHLIASIEGRLGVDSGPEPYRNEREVVMAALQQASAQSPPELCEILLLPRRHPSRIASTRRDYWLNVLPLNPLETPYVLKEKHPIVDRIFSCPDALVAYLLFQNLVGQWRRQRPWNRPEVALIARVVAFLDQYLPMEEASELLAEQRRWERTIGYLSSSAEMDVPSDGVGFVDFKQHVLDDEEAGLRFSRSRILAYAARKIADEGAHQQPHIVDLARMMSRWHGGEMVLEALLKACREYPTAPGLPEERRGERVEFPERYLAKVARSGRVREVVPEAPVDADHPGHPLEPLLLRPRPQPVHQLHPELPHDPPILLRRPSRGVVAERRQVAEENDRRRMARDPPGPRPRRDPTEQILDLGPQHPQGLLGQPQDARVLRHQHGVDDAESLLEDRPVERPEEQHGVVRERPGNVVDQTIGEVVVDRGVPRERRQDVRSGHLPSIPIGDRQSVDLLQSRERRVRVGSRAQSRGIHHGARIASESVW